MESEVRVRLQLAGLPPTSQVHIFDQGIFVARVDLAYEEQKLAIEYDGAHHENQREHDARRIARLEALGWEVIVVTSRRLRSDPDGLVDDIRAAFGRRSP